MARLSTFNIQGQGGGGNDFNRPDQIGADECLTRSRNVRAEAEYSVLRHGYVTLADAISSTVPIGAMGIYTRNVDTNDRLISVCNNKIYKIEPTSEGAWTEISGSPLTSSDCSIVSYRDWMFLFNGVDKPVRVSDTTITQDFTPPASLTVNTFLPAFGEVFNESLFVAGVPSAPNVVFTSKFATAANPEYIYNFAGSATTYGDGNSILFPSRVTGMRKVDGALVVFTIDGAFYIPGIVVDQTASSTFVVRFEVKPIAGASGCISQKACAVVETDVFYITPNKEIKSLKRALVSDVTMNTIPLSIKIQNFLKNMVDDNLSTAFMFYNDKEKEVHIVLKKKDGVYNGYRLIGDMNRVDQTGRPDWFIDEFLPFSSGVCYRGVSYYGAVNIGQTYQDNVGLADDDDAPIQSIRYSKEYNGNNPTSYKIYREFVWFGEITQTTVGYIDIYVDGVLTQTREFNADNLPSGSSNLEGGIGTQTIATYTIADDESEGDASTELFEVVVRIPLRAKGKKISYAIRTDGVNNYYRGRYIQYSIIPVSPLINPLIEK